MTESLAEVRSYDELHAALRARAHSLNVSRESIDAVAGLQSGYAAKLLCDPPLKKLGMDSLGPMLGALGLKMIVVEDADAMARFTSRASKREFAVPVQSPAVHYRISLRTLKRNGRKGGMNSRKFVGKRKARQLARKAARARWHKPRNYPFDIGSTKASSKRDRAATKKPDAWLTELDDLARD